MCWERYDRAVAALYQHSAWAGHLRNPWWMGGLSMGNTREVCSSQKKLWKSFPRRQSHNLLYSATGFLSFLGGYAVFLGPITGIMFTDVSHRSPLSLAKVFSKLTVDFLLSIGLYTALMSTFPRCIGHMEGIGIHMES